MFTRATLASWLERVGFSSYQIISHKTELPERLEDLPEDLEIDRESLATKGFYVVVTV